MSRVGRALESSGRRHCLRGAGPALRPADPQWEGSAGRTREHVSRPESWRSRVSVSQTAFSSACLSRTGVCVGGTFYFTHLKSSCKSLRLCLSTCTLVGVPQVPRGAASILGLGIWCGLEGEEGCRPLTERLVWASAPCEGVSSMRGPQQSLALRRSVSGGFK